MNHIDHGKNGENLATQFLETQGYLLKERNFRCSAGEIDLIAQCPAGQLCFIEVKTQYLKSGVPGIERISTKKQQRICRSARYYLMQNPAYYSVACRFDAMVVIIEPGKQPKVLHYPHAFAIDGYTQSFF
jgi:putative endonuclease